MLFYQRTTPGLAIYSYVIGDEETKEAVVIDPVRDVGEYLSFAKKNDLTITHILETHVHADFVCGSKELKAALDGSPLIHCSGMGGKEWIPSYTDKIVYEGDEIILSSFLLRAVHTPGHTPEHVMWVLEEKGKEPILFTGDCLFVGAVGRPDLLGKEHVHSLAHQLYRTITEKFSLYSDGAQIMPAHGSGSLCGKGLGKNSSSTLREERHHNPFLVQKSEEEWVNKLMQEMPTAPPYFLRMKEVNVKGAPILSGKRPGENILDLKEVQEILNKGGLLLDLRSKEHFSQGHIPGAINIPISPQLSSWAGWVLPEGIGLILFVESKEEKSFAIDSLLRVGFDTILGTFEKGMENWKREGLPVEKLPLLSTEVLFNELKENKSPLVLDVRTEAEWKSGYVPGAYWLPLDRVALEPLTLSKEQPIAVICGSGYRASIAASILKKNGYRNVSNVAGGMAAWQAKNYPVE